MADALCGPSNPLQRFEKHASADRTLQQDALRSHAPAAREEFRSPHAKNLAHEREFEMFQRGYTHEWPSISQQPLAFAPSHAQPFASPVARAPMASADWAADFQKMQLSEPPPSSAAYSQAWEHQPTTWSQPQLQHQNQDSRTFSGYQSHINSDMSSLRSPAFNAVDTTLGPVNRDQESWDVEAFERAFDSALAEEENDSKSKPEEKVKESATPESFPELNYRIGADTIPDSKDDANGSAMDDDLARTAGQLLDNVRDERSPKFKNSQFLGLMKKLRDKEALVRGENILDAQ